MSRLREDIRAQVTGLIEVEAAKDQDEPGLGFAILNVRTDPEDPTSAIVAWSIRVSTTNGRGEPSMEHRFPDVPANRAPTDEEAHLINKEYGIDFVADIKARRAERKAGPGRQR